MHDKKNCKCVEELTKTFMLGLAGLRGSICLPDPASQKMRFLECLKMSGREMFLSQKLKSVLLVICEKQSCTDRKSVLADKYITCRKWKVELRKQS